MTKFKVIFQGSFYTDGEKIPNVSTEVKNQINSKEYSLDCVKIMVIEEKTDKCHSPKPKGTPLNVDDILMMLEDTGFTTSVIAKIIRVDKENQRDS
jgi:hypothetical protein